MAPLGVQQVLKVLADQRSVSDLRRYFDDNPRSGSPVFAGRRFESLGQGDQRDDQNLFTPADMLAVQCLSVTVPIDVALDLVEGALGRQVSGLLSKIPADVILGTSGARSLVEDGSEADHAWKLLTEQTGVGWVTAGKLLARKRRHLIPVWDQVVRCAFDYPDHAWLCLDKLLRAEEGAVLRRLEDLRREAGLVPADVSLIRVLDVVIWMRHRDSHRQCQCPGLGCASV